MLSAVRPSHVARPAPQDDTATQHREVIERCWSVFESKLGAYGPAWRMLRLISIIDQIYIKARRIRRLEELDGQGKVEDTIADEYVGIINYAVIAIWQIENGDYEPPATLEDVHFAEEWTDLGHVRERYLAVTDAARELLVRKNYDYGEAWREMALPSITDELLSRTVRIKHLLEGDSGARQQISSQLYDTINYSVFAVIRLCQK